MRTEPFRAPAIEQPYEEKEVVTETTTDGTAAPESSTQPETPTPKPAPEKTFLQKYGIILLIILAVAAIYFFTKFQIVPKVV